MHIALSILIMLLMLSLLTVVHEFGHFIVARLFKVRVNEFSIFMGPKIYQKKTKKTGMLFSVRWLPIGGYCALEGEEEDKDSTDSFTAKPWYIRAAILVAGVLMNFLLAILIVFIIFLCAGYDSDKVSGVSDYMPMYLTGLSEGDKVVKYNGSSLITPLDYSMYQYVGEPKDVSFTLKKKNGGKETYFFERDINVNATENAGEDNPGTIDAYVKVYNELNDDSRVLVGEYKAFWDNNRSVTIELFNVEDGTSVRYFYGEKDGVYARYVTETDSKGVETERTETNLYEGLTDEEYIRSFVASYNSSALFKKFGFSFTYSYRGNFFECLGQAFLYTLSLVKSVLLSLWWLITGKFGLEAVSGPIGMVSIVDDVVNVNAAAGLKVLTLFDMTALISANLAVFNLLPIPGLDGGKLLFIAIELIRGGKKIPAEKEGIVSLIFMALLILFAIFIAGKDVFTIIKG